MQTVGFHPVGYPLSQLDCTKIGAQRWQCREGGLSQHGGGGCTINLSCDNGGVNQLQESPLSQIQCGSHVLENLPLLSDSINGVMWASLKHRSDLPNVMWNVATERMWL